MPIKNLNERYTGHKYVRSTQVDDNGTLDISMCNLQQLMQEILASLQHGRKTILHLLFQHPW